MKIIFKKPQKRKILIFDRQGLQVFRFFFHDSQFEVLDRRKESINIYILLVTLLNDGYKDFRTNYLKNYIKIVNPKIVLTFIDNNFRFFLLKKDYPKAKFICVQNGSRDENFFKELKKYYDLNKNLEIDYFFVFNKIMKKKLLPYIKSKYYYTGSIKNNFYFKKKNIKHRYKKYITFITQTTSFFRQIEVIVFKELQKFCSQKKINLVFLEKKNSDIFNEDFFRNKFGPEGWIYEKYKNMQNTYEIINQSFMVIFIDSTLGYEALSKGIRVACFPYKSLNKRFRKNNMQNNLLPNKFGYPENFANKGPFWSNYANKDMIIPILNKVYNYKHNQWKNIFNKYSSRIMKYDSNNKIFKKVLRNI
jgi:surface carbohydrate biosynthesis protein